LISLAHANVKLRERTTSLIDRNPRCYLQLLEDLCASAQTTVSAPCSNGAMLSLSTLITELTATIERHRSATGRPPDVLWVTENEAQLLAMTDKTNGCQGTFKDIRLLTRRPTS